MLPSFECTGCRVWCDAVHRAELISTSRRTLVCLFRLHDSAWPSVTRRGNLSILLLFESGKQCHYLGSMKDHSTHPCSQKDVVTKTNETHGDVEILVSTRARPASPPPDRVPRAPFPTPKSAAQHQVVVNAGQFQKVPAMTALGAAIKRPTLIRTPQVRIMS